MKQKKVRRYTELSALKGLIREKGTSYREISENIGIGLNTFSDKINGFYCFDCDEMNKIINELDISPDTVAKYFFPNILRNARNQHK